MQNLWKWSGTYFGYIDGNNLWSQNGKHVGQIVGDEDFQVEG